MRKSIALQRSLAATILAGLFLVLGYVNAKAVEACPSTFGQGEALVVLKPLALGSLFVSAQRQNDIASYIAIIRGKPADPGQWPATLIMCTNDGKYCTSTVVGVRVIVTAAHCFDGIHAAPGVPFTGTIRLPQGPPIAVTCVVHPKYRPFNKEVYKSNGNKMLVEWSADIAICKAKSDVPVPVVETLAVSHNQLRPGNDVYLVGYGCTLPMGGGDAETLYLGPAYIKENDPQSYFIHTTRRSTGGQAALCEGDSGGGSYDREGPNRGVYGINALADELTDSWIVDVTRPEIKQFVSEQTEDPAWHVCGLHADATKCRPLPQ